MTAFEPPVQPTPGQQTRTLTPRILTAGFGDGYRQDAGDGLNQLPNAVDLGWNTLDQEDADAIEQFFIDHKGYLAFDYTLANESTSRQWKCTTWTRAPTNAVLLTITAHFEQVFDLS